MSDENLNKDYINKLDNIIEFFEVEKEFNLHYSIIGEEDSKFKLTLYISIIAVLIATMNSIPLLEIFSKNYISILIFLTLFSLLIIFIGDIRTTSKRRHKYIKESVKFYAIINFFYSLKVLPYEVNLSPVIDIIEKRYHVKNMVYEIKSEEKYLYDIWYKEIIDCLDNINKEIARRSAVKTLVDLLIIFVK